jgi:Uma2 family endonuclease
MASATLIPVSEYLKTSYRPDCDYIDGELQERNLGERPHALLQGILFAAFYNNRRAWKTVALPEQRVQVSPTRYRVPDLCILHQSDPADPIVRNAPWICIEILSPEDRVQRLQERIDDYIAMGVGAIWVIDPQTRHAWVASSTGLQETPNGEFAMEGTPIRISLAEVFGEFDEIQTQG